MLERKGFLILAIVTLVTSLTAFTILSISIDSLLPQKAAAVNEQLNYSFVRKWGSFGTGPGQFNRPHDIAIDNTGNIYVSDRDNNRIQKFTHNGTFIKTWVAKAQQMANLAFPTVSL
jgi:streptogramin lyase